MGNSSVFGVGAEIYNLAQITIGSNTVVSPRRLSVHGFTRLHQSFLSAFFETYNDWRQRLDRRQSICGAGSLYSGWNRCRCMFGSDKRHAGLDSLCWQPVQAY